MPGHRCASCSWRKASNTRHSRAKRRRRVLVRSGTRASSGFSRRRPARDSAASRVSSAHTARRSAVAAFRPVTRSGKRVIWKDRHLERESDLGQEATLRLGFSVRGSDARPRSRVRWRVRLESGHGVPWLGFIAASSRVPGPLLAPASGHRHLAPVPFQRARLTHRRTSAARSTPPSSGTAATTSCLKRW